MKQNHPKNKTVQAAADAKTGTPTLLEFADTIQFELASSVNLPVEQKPDKRRRETPKWVGKITDGFKKTILKPVLKLKPKRKMDWQNYGKIIGVLDRQKTFFTVDIYRIWKEKGLDKITEEQWAKIFTEPVCKKLRQRIIKEIKRPVSDDEPLEILCAEFMDQRIAGLDMQRQIAFQRVAQQSAKNHFLFLKGMEQGYKLFFDDQCGLCGDRGRAQIHLKLLSSQYEIEKMRRMLPPRNDSDLYEHLKPWYRFPNSREDGIAWLRKVCDDISLYMTGKRGRPIGPRRAPVF